MDVHAAIYGRRAIRTFQEREVPSELVDRLIDAAIQAPSSMDLEPWAFVVIEGKKRLEHYSALAKERFIEHGPITPHMKATLQDIGFDIFHGAPMLIVLCATGDDPQAVEDCSLAAQNLMLAAYDMGLGTCPIGFARPWLRLTETKHDLKISPKYVPAFPLAVGYPAEQPHPHGRRTPEVIRIRGPQHASTSENS